MCERSKTPQAVRTARCSARIPAGYCTGISQPAKSTMRAPRRRWTAFNGVCNSAVWDETGLEGKAVAKNSGQQRGNPRQLFSEEQHAHADDERAAQTLDRKHMRSQAAQDAERAIDRDAGQQKRHAESERVHNQQCDALANRLLLRSESEQASQKRPDTRRPPGAERESHEERARVIGLGVGLDLCGAGCSVQPWDFEDAEHLQAE